MEKLKVLQHASLVELDALFATLQHRAFRGELFQSDLRSNIAATPTAPDFRQHLKLDVDKGLEALIYVTGRTAEYDFYKALKTLYVADKDHLKRQGRLIYGETHCAQKHGPVPQAAYDGAKFLNGEMLLSPFPEDALRAALRRTARQLIPLRQPDLSKLSASERESLDRAINICAPMSFEQLKNYTHDAAYLKTPPNAPIRVEDIVATFSGGA
ncbi:MAG: hypothetical protein JWQ90_2720 [Hydrocarboniphaga sp.]|nr:hypothetical protein [Hydrocarboniphaga sp.]